MLMFPRKSSSMLAAAASVIALSLAAGCQAPQPAATAAPASVQLQPYTAPDQSASAGVPSGWQVTSGQQTVIAMTGPGGAALTLGNTIVAQNAAFQPGKKGANGADLSMPYTATLAQKFTMIIQQGAAVSGKPTPQVIITSSTPIQLPPAVGECARFVASVSGEQGSMKLLAVLCSLRLDSGGAYKNISPTAQAVFQSYRIPATWLQKKLAPFNAPPAASSAADMKQANAIMQSTMAGEAAANNSANCFDLSVLRGTPTALLPRSCGGNAP
jgi:hypothetical protein